MRIARCAVSAVVLLMAARVHAQEGAPAPAQSSQAQPTPDARAATTPNVQGATAGTAAAPPSADPASAEPAPARDSKAAAATAASAPAATADSKDATQAAAPSQLSEAELAGLGLGVGSEGLDTDLHFTGFMDVNVLSLLNPKQAPLDTIVHGDEASFLVGHLNLYATKNIIESFRMMAEVRFLFSPNGEQALYPGAPITYTEVRDYSGTGASTRWGGISIERAYGEWSAFRFLTLRVGAFLTPYGIWNVDHGSPVFVPAMRPLAVNGTLFPEHQSGVEAFGRWGLGAQLTLRYHLTLSNGLGPVSEFRDLDANKAVGARLALEYVGLGTLQVGGSMLYGESSGGEIGQSINSTGTAVIETKKIADQFYQTSTAADVQWKYRGLQLQGEWVGQLMRYTQAGRTVSVLAGQLGVPVNGVPADNFSWAGYALVGYRLPWWGVMPFATLEYQRSISTEVLTHTTFSQVGLNIRPADAIVLKVQYMFALAGTPGTQIKVLMTQLAWAF